MKEIWKPVKDFEGQYEVSNLGNVKSFDGKFVKKWGSSMDIQRKFGVRHSNILACCNGNRPSSIGYKWEYAN